jgi:peptidoglycan/LPS O-acetylase OafA/YrhL
MRIIGGMNEIHAPRFRTLDVMRGLLGLYIVVEHAGVALWSSMAERPGLERSIQTTILAPLVWHVGTPMFFVISGYCIAASIDSHRRRGDSAWSFLGRRLRRIYPTYWAALLLFLVVLGGLDAFGLDRWHRNGLSHELASPTELTASQWVGNLTLTETWRPRIAGDPEQVFTRVGWSLCYQEQFYFVCFALLLLCPGRFHRALAVVSLGVIGLWIAANDVGMDRYLNGFFPMKWHEFLVGLAVYWAVSGNAAKWVRPTVVAGLVAAAAIGWATAVWTTLAASLFGLGLLLAHRHDERLAGVRCLAPLRACGQRAYSLYLIHLPVCMLVVNVLAELGVSGFWARLGIMLPAAALASVAAAWVFDAWIDTRIAAASKPRPRVAVAEVPRVEVAAMAA